MFGCVISEYNDYYMANMLGIHILDSMLYFNGLSYYIKCIIYPLIKLAKYKSHFW